VALLQQRPDVPSEWRYRNYSIRLDANHHRTWNPLPGVRQFRCSCEWEGRRSARTVPCCCADGAISPATPDYNCKWIGCRRSSYKQTRLRR